MVADPRRRTARRATFAAFVAAAVAGWRWWCGRAAWVWVRAGTMAQGRRGHAATALHDGRVLVAGGHPAAFDAPPLSDTEVWDPATNAWSLAGSLGTARSQAALVTLDDGRALAIGGWTGSGTAPTCELFDPATSSWSPTGSLATGRTLHGAALLADGRVLVAGGASHGAGGPTILDSAEVYDPATGAWSPTGAMGAPRQNVHLVPAPDGSVLAVGGDPGGVGDPTCERWDPATGAWSSSAPMSTGRSNDDAGGFGVTRLGDGRVLAACGFGGPANWYLDSAEVFDPASGSWSGLPALPGPPRVLPGVVPLPDDAGLVVAGWTGDDPMGDAYRWPGSGGWQTLPSLAQPRGGPTVTALANGDVLVTGGFAPGSSTATAERLTRRGCCWRWPFRGR